MFVGWVLIWLMGAGLVFWFGLGFGLVWIGERDLVIWIGLCGWVCLAHGSVFMTGGVSDVFL